MGQTRMFRDRVVSMEQTLEGGEKHLALLKALCREAFPSFEFREHALDHERDLFVMDLEAAGRRAGSASAGRAWCSSTPSGFRRSSGDPVGAAAVEDRRVPASPRRRARDRRDVPPPGGRVGGHARAAPREASAAPRRARGGRGRPERGSSGAAAGRPRPGAARRAQPAAAGPAGTGGPGSEVRRSVSARPSGAPRAGRSSRARRRGPARRSGRAGGVARLRAQSAAAVAGVAARRTGRRRRRHRAAPPAAVRAGAMNFELTEDQKRIRDAVRGVRRDRDRPGRGRAGEREDASRTRSWRSSRSMGILGHDGPRGVRRRRGGCALLHLSRSRSWPASAPRRR